MMQMTASLSHNGAEQEIKVSTNGQKKKIPIPARQEGNGSSVNGAELLLLALATCCCNDIYREAARRQMKIESVDVTASGTFGEAVPGSDLSYSVQVTAPAHSQEEIEDLVRHVDRIAEIHQTVRQVVNINLL